MAAIVGRIAKSSKNLVQTVRKWVLFALPSNLNPRIVTACVCPVYHSLNIISVEFKCNYV